MATANALRKHIVMIDVMALGIELRGASYLLASREGLSVEQAMGQLMATGLYEPSLIGIEFRCYLTAGALDAILPLRASMVAALEKHYEDKDNE